MGDPFSTRQLVQPNGNAAQVLLEGLTNGIQI
jgi:hypothetical protein